MIESDGRATAGVITRYRHRLRIPQDAVPVTLGEGETPLIEAPHLAADIGLTSASALFLKYEGTNPTGSFKDRGMSIAITAATSRGFRSVICASTGNTSASAAAYAARARLNCFVVIPQGRVAIGKLSQAVIHGAHIVEIDGNFDTALTIVRGLGDTDGCVVVNSVNPDRIEGQKTAAFEVCDTLGRAPDFHFLPVGNAGNITSYWRGYSEYEADGITHQRPRMFGYQAAGAAPLVVGHPIDNPETVATAIRIGNPASWQGAIHARDESGGAIDSVTDEEIIRAYRTLATTEGVFAEPASAASVAGLTKAIREDRIPAGALVVCTLTGHGLKDPATATSLSIETIRVGANLDDVRRALWP